MQHTNNKATPSRATRAVQSQGFLLLEVVEFSTFSLFRLQPNLCHPKQNKVYLTRYT